ncbi:MAG: hypothetical protein J5631_02230 [Spirochaetaceae bacterium]|nr:hypothetical protein [Spirochaetaceae bacterium]
MEEELVEKKEPLNYGKASLVLFVAGQILFWIWAGCFLLSSILYMYKVASKILEYTAYFLCAVSFLVAIAIFPVSIIGIIKGLKAKTKITTCLFFLFVQTFIIVLFILCLYLANRM